MLICMVALAQSMHLAVAHEPDIMQTLRRGPPLHLSASEEEVLVKKVLETHSPDGRHVDSELLLNLVESIMGHATTSNARVPYADLEATTTDNSHKADVFHVYEPFGQTIHKLSHEMMTKCSGDSHATTMMVFDLLGSHSWDGKLVLVIAAFAVSYGELFLITRFYSINLLAKSIAMLTQLPNNMEDSEALKPQFKALNSLVKAMVDVAKCITEFEGLPMQYKTLDTDAMATTNACIHVAAYWVIKSAVVSASEIANLMTMNHEKCNNYLRQKSSIGVRWELWSLVHKVRNTHGHLRKQLDACYQCIEAKLHHTLLSLFEETNDDNLKVLGMLLALKDDLPLWDGYLQEQICIDVLKSKIVLLLLSKIDISIAQVLLLQQTYDHPHRKSEKSYEIVWIPFQSSISWNHLEVKAFNQVANTVPWYSICRPWLLSSAVLNYMKEEWNYEDEPLIVVLDQQGRIICPNAMDMVIIWGGEAYPFSTSREKQLWGEARWTLELIMGDIDPLMSMWIKEGRTICLYGSDNINWIREFSSKMKSIIRAGVSLELIYVGNGNPGEHVREILDTITKENLSRYLPQTKIHFFWIRLNSMRSSKKRLGKDIQNDSVMEEVMSLLSHGIREEGWAVMGRGSSTDIIQLHGRKLMECLTLFPVWGDNIEKVGLLNAIRKAFDPAQDVVHCHHSRIVPYVEGTDEGLVICDECKRPMEKRILYQCLQYPGTNG